MLTRMSVFFEGFSTHVSCPPRSADETYSEVGAQLTPNPDQTPVATPVIAAPPGVTLASCADRHFGFASATDICEGRAVAVANNAPGTFRRGANLVTWSGDDGLHPIATATQTVTILDTTPPIITSMPPDIHLNDCKETALGLPTATDDCAGMVKFTNNAPHKFFVGATVVTWTATDAAGNHATDTQTVTVTDTVRPEVACRATEDPNEDDYRGHDRDEGGRDHHEDIDDGFFRVSSSDACTAAPPIRLGGFTLAPGEIIKMTQTHRSGVRRVEDVGRRHVRHFLVGRSANVITTVDGSGNAGSASCVVPHDHGRD